jgi:anaerobic magnesium-protoporphyrin IX monomethyl ester cyclase
VKIKKIIGIEPGAPGFHVFSGFKLPRLGLPVLGTILKEKGYEVKIYVEDISPIDWGEVFSADLILISTISSTTPGAYTIAKNIKENFSKRKKDIKIVMGGAHVSFLPEEALQNGADFVIRTEGEKALGELVDWLENDGSKEKLSSILGLSYKIDEEIFHNPPQTVLPDLDSLPQTDLSLIQGWNKPEIIPITTSRGCPFPCTFCSVIKMFGRKYRFRSSDKVIAELEMYYRKYPHAYIFFYDDNFTADRNRTKKLLREMLHRGITPPWTAQARLEVANDSELLELMHKTNCQHLYIGLESVNPETLKEYKKFQNAEDIEKAVKTLHHHKIKVHGMFVLGAEADDRETVKQTVKSAIKWKIDTLQISVLVPLPGTELYYKLKEENRITNFDWTKYDGHHVVFRPKKITPLELQIGVMLKAMPKFYSLWQAAKLALKFKWGNLRFRLYGYWMCLKWKAHNMGYIEQLKAVSLRFTGKQTFSK